MCYPENMPSAAALCDHIVRGAECIKCGRVLIEEEPSLAEVRQACLHGQCGPFAALMAARTGWPVGSIEYEGMGIHAVLCHPDGGVVDATGYHPDPDGYANDYAALQGFLRGGWTVVPLEGTEWLYGPGYEGADHPPPVLARLVFAVLDEIGYQHTADTPEPSEAAQAMLAEYLAFHED